jgi:prepilin-type N-terminal cleavage/methylation domain-containing protein
MRRRTAFTLLEVLLAMTIAVMVLAAVYTFVGYQLRLAQAGREVIERATLARSILGRIDTDVRATISLIDPGRFRLAPDDSGDTAPSSTTASTGATGTSSPSAASTASTASSSSGSSASTSSSSTPSGTTGIAPVVLPLGVMGTDTQLNIIVSRVPGEVWGTDGGDPALLTCDLRRITYWMGGDGDKAGLCRMEARLITSDEASDLDTPTGDVAQYLYASEVKSVEFGYFDGTSWQTSWDSTMPGPDQTTPLGSPRAISIKIGISQGSKVKTYRHVIAILTANGTPLNLNPEGGTTAP